MKGKDTSDTHERYWIQAAISTTPARFSNWIKSSLTQDFKSSACSLADVMLKALLQSLRRMAWSWKLLMPSRGMTPFWLRQS